MTQSIPSAREIEELFNIPVAVCVKLLDDHSASLGPRERQLVAPMARKRLLDFSTGRACAREALLSLGFPAADIGAGKDRKPDWPASFRGSISHCEPLAVAVVSDSKHCRSIGIDVEPVAQLEADVIQLICTSSETATLADSRDETHYRQSACLLFSIKESLFKCFYPAYGHWFDFQQATISLQPASGCYTVEFAADLPFASEPAEKFVGHFKVFSQHVASSAVLLQEPAR